MEDPISFSQMKTSTPRYRHIEIENSTSSSQPNQRNNDINRLLISTDNNNNNNHQKPPKTYSDKSITTCDDKSSQTESPSSSAVEAGFKINSISNNISSNSSSGGNGQNNKQYRSLDSGIISGLDHTNTTDLGSYSSSTPFSSLLNKTDSSKTEPMMLHPTQTAVNKQEKSSKSLPHVNIVGTKFTAAKLELSAPVLNESEEMKPVESNLRLRNSGAEVNVVKCEMKEEKGMIEIESNVKDEDELEDLKLLKKYEEVSGVVEEEEMEEDSEFVALTNKKESLPKRGFSILRLILNAIVFTILLILFIFIFLPMLMPSCCDYRRESPFFNEQNYNNDAMMPF